MRAVVQRVKSASVTVDKKLVSEIGRGLLIFAAVCENDTENDLKYMASKIAGLRIFPEGEKEAAVGVSEIGGEILAVSQFTLAGDVRKGRRPSFSRAMKPAEAKKAFEDFVKLLKAENLPVKEGVFQAMMDVALVNDGPYTILIDSEKNF